MFSNNKSEGSATPAGTDGITAGLGHKGSTNVCSLLHKNRNNIIHLICLLLYLVIGGTVETKLVASTNEDTVALLASRFIKKKLWWMEVREIAFA